MGKSLQRQRARMGFAVTATFALSMTASLAIAIHAEAQGTLTTGGFVLANVYMLQFVRPLEMLGTAARDVSQALEFVRPLILPRGGKALCGELVYRLWVARVGEDRLDHPQAPGVVDRVVDLRKIDSESYKFSICPRTESGGSADERAPLDGSTVLFRNERLTAPVKATLRRVVRADPDGCRHPRDREADEASGEIHAGPPCAATVGARSIGE
ncbi:MAG: hypothetical protein ABI887_22565 [Burkholderiales bacterium]